MLVCVFCGCLCGDDLCAIGCLWFDFIWYGVLFILFWIVLVGRGAIGGVVAF